MFWRCQKCSKMFDRPRNKVRPRFCSQKCYHSWNVGEKNKGFDKGHSPWNKNTKGLIRPNKGNFQKGQIPITKLAIGNTTVRTDKNGKKRVWVKVADNGNPYDWKLRSIVNWERAYGSIPKGMIVHHKNRDTLDDSINNLELQTRAEHLLEHKQEFEQKRLNALKKSRKHPEERYST